MAARAAEIQRTMRRALPRVARAGNRSRPRGGWACSGCVFDAETRRRGDRDAEGDARKSTPEKAEEAERRLTDDKNRSSVPPRGSWDCSGCLFDAETRRRGDRDAEGDARKSTPEKAEEAERRLTDDKNRSSVPPRGSWDCSGCL